MADVLELGIPSIDAEHRELLRLFEAFARGVQDDAPAETVHEIVHAAIACANAHFEHEESLGDEAHYPNAADHKFRHRHLRMQLTTLVGDTVGLATGDPVTEEHLFEMRRLLEEHIAGPDRELAEYLKSAVKSEAA